MRGWERGAVWKKLDVKYVSKCISLQTLHGAVIVLRRFSFSWPLKLDFFHL